MSSTHTELSLTACWVTSLYSNSIFLVLKSYLHIWKKHLLFSDIMCQLVCLWVFGRCTFEHIFVLHGLGLCANLFGFLRIGQCCSPEHPEQRVCLFQDLSQGFSVNQQPPDRTWVWRLKHTEHKLSMNCCSSGSPYLWYFLVLDSPDEDWTPVGCSGNKGSPPSCGAQRCPPGSAAAELWSHRCGRPHGDHDDWKRNRLELCPAVSRLLGMKTRDLGLRTRGRPISSKCY